MNAVTRFAAIAAVALTSLLATEARAQAPAERCTVIPDTVPGPSAQQIAERNTLRDQIAATLQAHGQPAAGLLMVDVDSTRRGKLLFMQAQLPDSTRRAAIGIVSTYLETLQQGRGYQALIRIDGDYPAMTPGRRHCRPELANGGQLSEMMQRVLEHHPESGRHGDNGLVRRAVVRLVVTREGQVAFAEVDTPSGDEFIDGNVEAIAMRLRFRPATLDGAPFDVRFRFTMTFTVR